MSVAVALVLFAIACALLYAMALALIENAGELALFALVMAGITIVGGVLNLTGAPTGLHVATGVLLCLYALVAFVATVLLWEESETPKELLAATGAFLAFAALAASAVLQFAVVA